MLTSSQHKTDDAESSSNKLRLTHNHQLKRECSNNNIKNRKIQVNKNVNGISLLIHRLSITMFIVLKRENYTCIILWLPTNWMKLDFNNLYNFTLL